MDTNDLKNIALRFKALSADIEHMYSETTRTQVRDEVYSLASDIENAISKRDKAMLVVFSGDDEMVKYLDGIVGVVEANSYEQQMLWQEYAEEGAKYGSIDRIRFPWKSTGHGPMEVIGHFGDMPICLALMTVTINGHKILFYDVTSMVTHHEMIRQWLDKNMPASARHPDGRVNSSDPINFCNIFPRVMEPA